MRKFLVLTTLILYAANPMGLPAFSVERTSDIIFKTFEKIEERYAGYEEEKARIDRTIADAGKDAQKAIREIEEAQARGDV